MTTAADLLSAAHALLADPERWLHDNHGHAVDAAGAPCGPREQRAVRWDVYGALQTGGAPDRVVEEAVRRLAAAVAPMTHAGVAFEVVVVAWHDAESRSHVEVCAALAAAAGREGLRPSTGAP